MRLTTLAAALLLVTPAAAQSTDKAPGASSDTMIKLLRFFDTQPDDWINKEPYGSFRFDERLWAGLNDGKGAMSYGIDVLDVLEGEPTKNGSVTVRVIGRHGPKASVPGGVVITRIQFLCAKKQERTVETFVRTPDGTEDTKAHENENYRPIASGSIMELAMQVACRLK